MIFENLNSIKSKYNRHLSEQEDNSVILKILKCLLSFTVIPHEYDIISYHNPDEYALVLKNDNFSYKSVFKWSEDNEEYLVPITLFKFILADYYFSAVNLDESPIHEIWSEEFDKVFNPFNSN